MAKNKKITKKPAMKGGKFFSILESKAKSIDNLNYLLSKY